MISHGCNITEPPDGTGFTLDEGDHVTSQPFIPTTPCFPPGMAIATAIVAQSQTQRESPFNDIPHEL